MKEKKRVGGRPKLAIHKKRNKVIELSLNEFEYSIILEKLNIIEDKSEPKTKKRKNIAPTLRNYLLNLNTNQTGETTIDNSKLIFEINKIGVNINQISKVVNQKNKVFNVPYLTKEVNKLNQELEKLSDLISSFL